MLTGENRLGLSRRFFTLEALTAEWRRKHLRSKVLGCITVVAVLILFMNPETLPMAIYIDSVGIEAFVTLLELNILVGLLLYRQQLVSLCRTICASRTGVGAALRKAMAFPSYSMAALRGEFR